VTPGERLREKILEVTGLPSDDGGTAAFSRLSGVHRELLSRYAHDKMTPRGPNRRKIEQAAGVEPDYFGWPEPGSVRVNVRLEQLQAAMTELRERVLLLEKERRAREPSPPKAPRVRGQAKR